jgi:hypothetical protein
VPGDSATVQLGINGALDGDTVFVAAGTYSGPGNEAIRFLGKKILLKSEAGPEQTILLTLDTVRTIIFDNGEDSNSILDGFTISGGYEEDFDWSYFYRGGISSKGASPIIQNCVVSGCFAFPGGGAYFEGGKPVVKNCIFKNNHALYLGGAIYAYCDTASFLDSRIINNHVKTPADSIFGGGGGVTNYLGHSRFVGCYIGQNRGTGWDVSQIPGSLIEAFGGGILCFYGNLEIDSCTLAQNSAGVGGAITLLTASASINQSLIYNNTAILYAGIWGFSYSGETSVLNCTFACNYSAKNGGDGIVYYCGFSYPFGDIGQLDVNTDYNNLANYAFDRKLIVKNNIFAFNSSAAIYNCGNEEDCYITYNNVWNTVSGPDYSGISIDPAISGNISADPLFCEVSDSGFRLDVSSPCVGTGEDGSNMGVFGIGCYMYDGSSPKSVVANLIDDGLDSAPINQPIIDSAMNQTNPWDTLIIETDLDDAYIDQLMVDKPLYIYGQGMTGPDAFNLTSSDWWPYHTAPAVFLQSFCIFQNMHMYQDNILHTSDLFAIGIRQCSPIIKDCYFWSNDGLGFPAPQHIYEDASPIIRNCHIKSGLLMWGAFDCVASHNYWGYDHCYFMNDYEIIDGVEYPGRGYVLWQPCLTETPTDVHEELPYIPTKLELDQNHPNPFNASTTISFAIPRKTTIKLNIYNILGQEVNTLFAGEKQAGRHSLIWNGKDHKARPVPSGIYIYKLNTLNNEISRKMVLIK